MPSWTDWNDLVDPSRRYESPCKNARPTKITKPTHIVIHITGTIEFQAVYSRFMTPKQASAHYLVDREGHIHQFARDADRAWHAGIEAVSATLYARNDGSWRKYLAFFDWEWKNGKYPAGSKYLDAQYNEVPEEKLAKLSVKERSLLVKLVQRSDRAEWTEYEYFDKRWGRLDQPFYFDKNQDPNGYSIGIEMLSVGSPTPSSSQYPEPLYEGMDRLLTDLCAKYGIPRDRQHIIGHEDVHPIARCGWDPGQGFDWPRILKENASPVTFPLDGKTGGPGPVRYLFLNETRKKGGFYPLGFFQNIHSGVHLSPEDADGPLSPVRCLAPGYLVAARLTGALPATLSAGNAASGSAMSALTEELALAGNSFVLVRHVLEEIPPQNENKQPRTFTFYTLSMHLSPPDWSNASNARLYAQVPWLDALVRRRNGSVIAVDPEVPSTFGKRWLPAVEEQDASRGGGTLKTFGATFAQTIEEAIGPEENGRTVAVCRTADAGVKKALDALSGGKVITSALPAFVFRRGDVLGYIPSTGFLHWEVLAPAGAQGGLEDLLAFACEKLGLGEGFFAQYVEKNENNIFDTEEDEIAMLLELLPDDDADKQDALAPAYTGEHLVRLFQTSNHLAFATGKPPTADVVAGELSYPLRINLENFRHAVPLGTYTLKLRFEPAFPERSVELDLSAGYVDVMVPAGAKKIIFESDDYFIQLDQKRPSVEEDAAHFQHIASARFRRVVLEHLNEWSKEGLLASMKPRRDPEEDLEPYAAATAFWANEEVPVGTKDSEEKKLFADPPSAGQLPERAKLAQAHPLIVGWLAGLLVKHNLARFQERFVPPGGTAPQKLFFLAWMPDYDPIRPRTVGDPLHAVAVATSDMDGDAALVLQARGPGAAKPVVLAHGRYDKGILRASLPCPFWGDWTLEVDSQSPEIGHVNLSGLAPLLADIAAPVRDKKGQYTWTIQFAKNRPSRVRGLVLLEHWTTKRGEAPSGPGTTANVAIPIEAIPPPANTDTKSPLQYDPTGQFIVGTKKPDEDWVTPKTFAFKEYSKVFQGDSSSFRLAVSLAERLVQVRAAYTSLLKDPKAGVRVLELSADGLSVRIACSKDAANNHTHLVSAAKQNKALFLPIEELELELRLSVPAPPAEVAGPVVTSFDPAAALSRLLAGSPLGSDEQMHVRFGVFFPNGGSLVLPSWPQPPAALDIVDIDPVKLRAECHDALEAFTAAPGLTLTKPQFGPITTAIDGDSLTLTAPLHGAASDWALAKPKFSFKSRQGAEQTMGTPMTSHNTLVAKIKLNDSGIAGTKITFKARVTNENALFDGQKIAVSPVSVDIDTTPRLDKDSVKLVWTAADLEVHGTALSYPTNKAVALAVYKIGLAGEEDTGLGKNAQFANKWNKNEGFPDGAGRIIAYIGRTDLAQKLSPGDRIRVELFRPTNYGPVLGKTIESVSVCETVPEV